MNKIGTLTWIGMVSLVAAAGAFAQSGTEEVVATKAPDALAEKPLYFVAAYDAKRDPAKDLEEALKLAQKEGKNIILQVGGDWCGWCGRMSDYFHKTQSVHDVLSKNFVIMKVNISTENKNEDFLSAYPKVPAAPHLFVLDGKGKLLCSQYTGDLEEGSSYSEKAVLEFLNKWTPSAVSKATPQKEATPPAE